MKPLLALLAGTALAAGPSGQAWAAAPPGDDGVTSGRSGLLRPFGADAMPAPPPPEIALGPARSPASRVRAVILTVADGEKAEPVAHSAFLNCAPIGGSHPSPAEACQALARIGLDPSGLRTADGTELCPMIYSPVTVTANGIWDGKYFQYQRTFGNACEKRSAAGALFDI